MRRFLYPKLIEWKNKERAMPLMLIGARQTGKTYLLKEFCKNEYAEFLYFNFDDNEHFASFFSESLTPSSIVSKMEIYLNREIDIQHTIFFFDEIQNCERAIASLKYFAEAEENYRIVTAGSLLGVKLNRFQSSFPVGKVEFMYLYPFTFEEFLWAIDEHLLADTIENHVLSLSALPEILHDKALDLYRKYLYVGGMPASIMQFIECQKDVIKFSPNIQRDIITAYLADMVKYSTGSTAVKASVVFNVIPAQLAKDNSKFQYKLLSSKANKEKYESAIDWLLQAGTLLKVSKVNLPQSPLSAYVLPNHFKLYMSDVGLLAAHCKLQSAEILSDTPSIFKGAVAENYVAQSLKAHGRELYYWESNGTAEIDYLLNDKGDVIPVEVKSSDNTHSKSLNAYMTKYNPPYAIRFSSKNFGFEKNIKSIPLYAIDWYLEEK